MASSIAKPVEKQPTLPSRSLLSRLSDALYVVYLVIHLLASALIDSQLSLYPYSVHIFPTFIQNVLQNYMETSKDPFLLGVVAQDQRLVWFKVLLWSEIVFQIPCFVVGIWGLCKDEKRVYPILIAYGTLAASSTLQCICSVLFGSEGQGLSSKQIFGLLQNYVPFCILPTMLTIDLSLRIIKLLPSSTRRKDE